MVVLVSMTVTVPVSMTVTVSMTVPVSMLKGRTVRVLMRKINEVAEAVEAGVDHPHQSEQAA